MDIEKIKNIVPFLSQLRRGVEREVLRIQQDGHLSSMPHPAGLGHPLTHPNITTDYAEAQLELITPALHSVREVYNFLEKIHLFCRQEMNHEMFWPSSMPCPLEDSAIPLAKYGKTPLAKFKETYREGLKNRYGERMQTICGIHFNFSFPEQYWKMLHQQESSTLTLVEFTSAKYFAGIRNIHRYSWMVPLMLGASPALCTCFIGDKSHQGNGTKLYSEATSIRLSEHGYQNNSLAKIPISFNSLENYVQELKKAVGQTFPLWEKIGVQDPHGKYLQLNTNLLQIENEFYGVVRPKPAKTQSTLRPLRDLQVNGVNYLELRAIDINPFCPVGIELVDLALLDLFMTFCLVNDSPDFTLEDELRSKENLKEVVYHGLRKDLSLVRNQADEIITHFKTLAEIFCETLKDNIYLEAFEKVEGIFRGLQSPPAQKVVDSLGQRSFCAFNLEQSKLFDNYFSEKKLSAEETIQFRELARESFAKELALQEKYKAITFEEYLADYLK